MPALQSLVDPLQVRVVEVAFWVFLLGQHGRERYDLVVGDVVGSTGLIDAGQCALT